MKKIILLAVGVTVGVLAARQFQKTEQGREFFETLDERSREFTNAIKDGYTSRERELKGE
ncbi:hypothetical protein [Humidisolicoccus flavus]|uniref:hypothetical protein n=1 Tax=Humidisolicoccus flavus TaxID=3111414 RepID=UPI003247FF5A